MRENTIRTIWDSGNPVINAWCGIPSAIATENMAQAGWDSVTCDLQHGLIDYQSTVAMLQAIATTQSIPLVRVPWNEPGIIMKCLDAGALGVICPMVNSREECEAFVGACRYAPDGYRSFGPTRALWTHGADYAKGANKAVVTMAMIETQKAVDNLDDILSTPQLDAIYIGPADLGLSLGGEPKGDQTDPKIVEAIQHILASAKKHKIRAGIHCSSTAYAKKAIDWGFEFVTVMADNLLLNTAAKATVNEMKGTTSSGSTSSY
ncbi:MAG: aldolase/citrate lyase family protein [Burkholderiaceae bacterium]